MSVPKLTCPIHGADETATWLWLEEGIHGFDNRTILPDKKCSYPWDLGGGCGRPLRIRWT